MKKVVNPPAAIQLGPYNSAIVAGDFMYISGQIGLDRKTGAIAGTTLEEEIDQAMKNVGEILKLEGLTYDNIVKSTIYLMSMGSFSIMNKVYGSYFTPGQEPAREAIQVSALPKAANFEISVVAYIPPKKK